MVSIMLLVVLLLAHQVAGDLPKQFNYVTKKFDSCPSVGYFFKREENIENSTCYLCFCQDSGEATCWPRENKKCDTEDYIHVGEKKGDTRLRRSPEANPLAAGLSDVFFRDAARELFNKQVPAICKPFQSSFSEGCPPADWCVGCTVCDCDANGRWDCHILSFCDKAGNPAPPPSDLLLPKKHRTRRRSFMPKSMAGKSKLKPTRRPKTTPKPSKKKGKKNPAQMKNKTSKEKAAARTTAKYNKQRPTPTRVPKSKKTPKPKPKNQPKRNIQRKTSRKARRKLLKDKKKVTTTTTTTQIRAKRDDYDSTLLPLDVTSKILSNSEFKKDLQQQISKQIMDQFQSAIHGAINKKMNKKDKRSIVKKVIIINEVDVNDTNNETGAKSDTWLENVDINDGLMENRPSNTVKIYQRYKRNLVGRENKTTTSLNDAGEGPLSIPDYKIELTTERPPTGTAKDIYYKYTIENSTNHLTTIRNEDHMHESNSKNYKMTRSVQNLDQNLTVLQLIDRKQKVLSGVQKTDVKVFETTTEIVMTENDTIYNVISANNLMISTATDKINKSITEHGIVYLADKIMNANDLKFSKWSQVKVLKEAQSLKSNNNSKLVPDANDTKERQKVHSFDVGRKVGNISKKYKLQKIVKVSHKPVKNKNLIYNKTNNDMNVVKNFLNNILVTKRKRSKKSNNVIKYLQKYFRKLFSRPKNKKKTDGIPVKTTSFDKHLQTLCETFGPCYLTPEKELKLESKIETLNTETYKMLRSIQIIHGLLKLIDFATNDKDLKGVNIKTKTYFKNDIKKLQAVLRNTYLDEENIEKLTSTQKTQIDFIKKNAITFMVSAGKFAGILNDIIDIIHSPTVNDKRTSHRIYRLATVKTKEDVQYDTLKNLLVKFNTVQNAFMKKIYQLLPNTKVPTDEEKKIPMHDEKLNLPENYAKESKQTGNNSEAINIYTKNIIKNLRKLKNLAQRLESKSRRRKRDLKDDDALEYLLMLMEYLLKQNHQLDSAPVNDGIDLLIEAIKHAPDIKPIRKKVLQNLPNRIQNTYIHDLPRASTTTEYIELITIKDDNSSDLNTLSKEENLNSKLDDVGTNTQSAYDEDNEIEKDNYNRKSIFDSTTDMDYYKKDENEKSNQFETSTESPLMTGNENEEATKNVEIFFSSHEKGDDGQKYDIYNGEAEEDVTLRPYSTTVYSEKAAEEEFKTEMKDSTTEFVLEDIKMRHFTNGEMTLNESVDKKLDWIEPSYEDMKEDENKTEKPVSKIETTTRLRRTDIVKEIRKEKKKWYHPEDVIYKKEMNLLNSLDYTVGRSDSKEDGSDTASKEGADDKFSVEFK